MKRFLPYARLIRNIRGPLIVALICALVYGIASGFSLPYMIKGIFPRIFSSAGGDATTPLTLTQLLMYTLWLPVVFLIRGLGGYGNSYFISLCGVQILEALRLEYFRKLQVLPLAFFQKRTAGDLISRGMADTNQLQVTLTTFANEAFKQPVVLISAIVFIITLATKDPNVWVILGGLGLIPLTVFPIRYVGRKLLRRAREVQEGMGSVTARFSENLGAAREVRAFGLEERETQQLATSIRQLFRVQMKVVKYAQALSPSIEFLSAVGISVTLVLAYQVQMRLETFIALVTALYMSYDPVKKLGVISNELRRGEAALDRVEAVLNELVTITDAADAQPLARATGELAFDQVSFAYDESSAPALHGVTVRIPTGTTCALVGPTGAGKSTFANLVPRFFDASTGVVRVDGRDVRSIKLADLRRNIALVSQDPVLFRDTIANNILISRPRATRAEIEAAARDAYAHDFISALPQGYETVLGERGIGLSGGQKQRLTLARAFLRNAPILILDEATSALDSESEAAIQQALRKLVVGKTVLIIAHRFSTIRDASMILVFDQGRIVAQGDHATLHAGNALYRSLYEGQRGGA